MKFLVTRKEALQNSRNKINSSEMWPCIVEANTHEEAVHEAHRIFWGNDFTSKRLPRSFIVIAIIDAQEITFRDPRPEIVVESHPVNIPIY